MRRVGSIVVAGFSALLVLPTQALAFEVGAADTVPMLRIVVSLVGLMVAAVLLVEAGRVKNVAWGGAIAEKINYVTLAILCLAASALARWTQNFVGGVTFEQVQIASEVLVIVAMVLLGMYFASVRSALSGFLMSMTGGERLADESAGTNEETLA